jgi:hypothetical protein
MLQELSPGSVVSERFQIERMAGSGGMGAVYRAVDRQTQQPVAVKVLFDGADKARFHREALLLAELSHPGIVSYVAHGHTDGGHPFLAMQWLPGHDLAERLRHGGLNLKEALHLARRVAEALSVAHGRGVVHREIVRLANCRQLLVFFVARNRLGTGNVVTRPLWLQSSIRASATSSRTSTPRFNRSPSRTETMWVMRAEPKNESTGCSHLMKGHSRRGFAGRKSVRV